MKAIVRTSYGPPRVLRLQEVEKPTAADDKVLVQVRAVALNIRNSFMLRGQPFFIRLMGEGLFKPWAPILGADIAGRVEAVGRNVKQFQPGDEVFGDISRGAFAEYVCVREDVIALKPVNSSFEEAAAACIAAITPLQGLRDHGNIRPGLKVLINGASGGIGTFAVQIAKSFGAEVTGVCSAQNLDLVRSIGADHVIDYTREDFTRNGQQYDLILAVRGYHPLADYERALSPTGVYVMVGGSWPQVFEGMILGPRRSRTGTKKMCGAGMKVSQKDLLFVKELMETGKVKPIIDRRYPFSAVSEAIRYLENGHARGKVVVTWDDSHWRKHERE